MRRARKIAWILSVASLAAILVLAVWLFGTNWPNPTKKDPPWSPDVVVVLGGGDAARGREAMRWHQRYPAIPILVTGDGGVIQKELLAAGLPAKSLLVEDAAKTTEQNARFTKQMLADLGCHRALLVTNWFHAPRALATFRKVQPDNEFAVAFEPVPSPPTLWDLRSQRRERLAVLWYFARHGVNSFLD